MRKVLIAAVLLVALTGCVPQVHVTPVPTPSGTPLFASDADALKAATDAYAKYLSTSDSITASGGQGSEAYKVVDSPKLASVDIASAELYASKGYHSVGFEKFDSPELQAYYPSSFTTDVVAIYVCLDLTDVQVLDANGASVVSPNRLDRQRFEVHFDWSSKLMRLLVASDQPWSGEDTCS